MFFLAIVIKMRSPIFNEENNVKFEIIKWSIIP